MKLLAPALVAISAIGSPVLSETLTYGHLNLTLGGIDAGGNNLRYGIADGTIGAQFGNVDVWASGSHLGFDVNGTKADLSAVTLGAGYTYNDMLRVDLSTNSLQFSSGGSTAEIRGNELGVTYLADRWHTRLSALRVTEPDTDLKTIWGLSAGFEATENLSFSGSIHGSSQLRDNDTGPLVQLGVTYETDRVTARADVMSLPLNGQDLTLMGVAGDVDVNDRLNLDASYAKLEFNGQDLDLALLGATYGVTQTIDVYGNVGQLSGGGDSITLARLGAEYAFNDRVSAFAELQRLDIQAVSFPSMDGTGISLGLKVDLGAKPNSHKSSIERLNDTVSAYTLDWF